MSNETFAAFEEKVHKILDHGMLLRAPLGNLPLEASLRVLDLVDRYHASADALEQCGQMIHALRIERYWGDYAL